MIIDPKLYKLSNGITVILDPWESATTSIAVGFRTGAYDESPSEYGLTHFCEHMISAASKNFPEGIDSLAKIGGRFNAHTSHKQVWLDASVLPKNVNYTLDAFSDMLQNSTFAPEVVERERGAILDEYRMVALRDDAPGNWFNQQIRSALHGNSTKIQAIGTHENIKSFTREQIIDLYNRRFSAKNCVIVISGMFDANILATLESKFSFMPSFDVTNKIIVQECNNAEIRLKSKISSAFISIFSACNINLIADENLRYNMCITAFKEYLCTCIKMAMRDVAYDMSIDITAWDKRYLLGIQKYCNIADVENMVREIAKNCYHFQKQEPITDAFLQKHINNIAYATAVTFNDSRRRCDTCREEYLLHGRLPNWNRSAQILPTITVDDVVRAGQDLFTDESMSFGLGGPDVPELNISLGKLWRESYCDAPAHRPDLQALWDKSNANKILLATNQKDDKIH